ncbi:hypothetical protein [Planktothrix pseudagardhii]|uniref:Uncharacterized protein n=1 Tax=Planktothrix pseudagardhii TaxID=132604 RepID=A0A9W4CEW2_9CYAN|nr:hypothetical protein [Planktothrix pseudagardhii]CAD5917792.1 hypothetical protein NO713_00462 [Planktothrix pseudagardhii]
MKQQLLKGVVSLLIWTTLYAVMIIFQPFIFQTQWAPLTTVDPNEWMSIYRKKMLLLAGVSAFSTLLWLGWALWKERNILSAKQSQQTMYFWWMLLGLQMWIALFFSHQYSQTIPEFKPLLWSTLFSLLNIFVFYWVTTAIITPGQLEESVLLSQTKILESIRKKINPWGE